MMRRANNDLAFRLASALAFTFKAWRLYPERHPERRRQEHALSLALEELARAEGSFDLDFHGASACIEGSPPVPLDDPRFGDLVHEARERSLRRFRLAGPEAMQRARDLLVLLRTPLGNTDPPAGESHSVPLASLEDAPVVGDGAIVHAERVCPEVKPARGASAEEWDAVGVSAGDKAGSETGPTGPSAAEIDTGFATGAHTAPAALRTGAHPVAPGFRTGAQAPRPGVRSGAQRVPPGLRTGAHPVPAGLRTGAHAVPPEVRTDGHPVPPGLRRETPAGGLPVTQGLGEDSFALGIEEGYQSGPQALRPETAAASFPGGELIAQLQQLWAAIARERRYRSELAESLVTSIVRLPGDGVVEPVTLIVGRDAVEAIYAQAINVARLCWLGARSAGLPRENIKGIVEAALLADIGMLEVPPGLLTARGRLPLEDFRAVQRHPEVGARMILATPSAPQLAGVIAYEHQMRGNGKGYPSPGRPWKPIAESLLVQAADIYAAVRSPRPYRAPVAEDEARQLVRRLTPSWLDSRAVKLLFERACPEGCTIDTEFRVNV